MTCLQPTSSANEHGRCSHSARRPRLGHDIGHVLLHTHTVHTIGSGRVGVAAVLGILLVLLVLAPVHTVCTVLHLAGRSPSRRCARTRHTVTAQLNHVSIAAGMHGRVKGPYSGICKPVHRSSRGDGGRGRLRRVRSRPALAPSCNVQARKTRGRREGGRCSRVAVPPSVGAHPSWVIQPENS